MGRGKSENSEEPRENDLIVEVINLLKEKVEKENGKEKKIPGVQCEARKQQNYCLLSANPKKHEYHVSYKKNRICTCKIGHRTMKMNNDVFQLEKVSDEGYV